MGSAVSAPTVEPTRTVTAVEIRSRFGVLYDDAAAEEFKKHATKDAAGQDVLPAARVTEDIACGMQTKMLSQPCLQSAMYCTLLQASFAVCSFLLNAAPLILN